jgi:poly(3-hydroxybutyrate) depolymerase
MRMMPKISPALTALLIFAGTDAFGAQTVTLPAWVCAHADAVFRGGFESTDSAVPHDPSMGSGGAYPGFKTAQVSVQGLGTQPYYLYVPTNYSPAHSWPLLLALHGAGGPGTADAAAKQVRGDWSGLATGLGVIVIAPVGTDNMGGGWIAPLSASNHPTDYDILAQVVTDVEATYNIERSRLYGWGYSAGGHVMHSLALNGYNATLNADSIAAYAVSAGVLAGWACRSLDDTQCQQQVLMPALRKVPVDIHVGNTDSLLSYAQADEGDFAATGWTLGSTLFYTVFSGGHIYTLTHLQQAWLSMCSNAVVP